MARLAVAVLLLAPLAGCASLDGEPAGAVRGYRRVGVLPFTDGLGRRAELWEAVARALRESGLDPISPEQTETVLRELGITPGEPVGDHDLPRLAALLKADALLIASLDCRPGARTGSAAALLLDPRGGEPLLRSRFEVPGCAAPGGPARLSRALALVLRKR